MDLNCLLWAWIGGLVSQAYSSVASRERASTYGHKFYIVLTLIGQWSPPHFCLFAILYVSHCNELTRGTTELVQHFRYRGSSLRRKNAAWHKSEMFWLSLFYSFNRFRPAPAALRGGGGQHPVVLISHCFNDPTLLKFSKLCGIQTGRQYQKYVLLFEKWVKMCRFLHICIQSFLSTEIFGFRRSILV
jgi:hypothetical protein